MKHSISLRDDTLCRQPHQQSSQQPCRQRHLTMIPFSRLLVNRNSFFSVLKLSNSFSSVPLSDSVVAAMALGGAPPLARAAVVKFPAAAAAAKFTCRHLASYSTALFRSLLVPVGSRTPWAGCGLGACNRGFASDDSFPKALERDLKDTMNIPVGGENLYRRVGGPGYPMLFDVKYDRPTWQPLWEDEHEVIPRDGYG